MSRVVVMYNGFFLIILHYFVMESQLHNLATPTHRIQRVSSLDARSEIIDTTHLTQGWGSDVPQLFRERSRSGSNDSVESK
jgi:hypothetical protein